jgi:putative addiction module CopG family antidote
MTSLAADLEQFVQEEVASGRFPNRESVVAHALRLMQREREEAVHGIRSGLADVATGRVQPLGDAFADLRRELNVRDEA